MKNSNSKKKKFIERAQFVHGSKYDYSKVMYKSSAKKVAIGCPKHGIFWQAPTQHLEGHGCPFCKYNRMTREEFMAHVIKLYGDNYEWSKCDYTHKKRLADYITITCKIHGDFKTRVNAFLQGKGCPKCSLEEWKRAKLIKKPSVATSGAGEPKEDVINLTFPVKVQYQASDSKTNVQVCAEPFGSKPEAEKFIEDLKLFIEMTDSVLIEAIVVEKKEPILDCENAALIIKCLNLATNEDYLKWWDNTHPYLIPRNLHEFYPNFNLMFNGRSGIKA
jgi:hypothetical protein